MKLFFDSIGCKLNQSEVEKLAGRFRVCGHVIVSSPKEADYIIINTCAVTAAASADSRKAIRRAARQGDGKIIATGCYATVDPAAIQSLPSVEYIVSNNAKESIPDFLPKEDGQVLMQEVRRISLPGNLRRTRAFIKVQDGCNNHCTFCITRIARGKSHSVAIKEIFHDISIAIDSGVKEIVLTGVNLGAWGLDFESPKTLADLIRTITTELQPQRLRISSLEPWDIDQYLIDTFLLRGFCRHLHIPLQSGCDETLKRMERKISPSEYHRLIKKIRKAIPEVAITTDIIVGFPGETDNEFEQSLRFVHEMEFAGGHVFRFSPRPGTPAARFTGSPEAQLTKSRSKLMREELIISQSKYREQFLGKTLPVLWLAAVKINKQYKLSGLSDNYIKIKAESKNNLENHISTVFIRKSNRSSLIGEITD